MGHGGDWRAVQKCQEDKGLKAREVSVTRRQRRGSPVLSAGRRHRPGTIVRVDRTQTERRDPARQSITFILSAIEVRNKGRGLRYDSIHCHSGDINAETRITWATYRPRRCPRASRVNWHNEWRVLGCIRPF